MRITPALLIIGTAAALTACATQDTNPYYKVSSKYPAQTETGASNSAPIVHSASHTTPITYRAANIAQENTSTTPGSYSIVSGDSYIDSATGDIFTYDPQTYATDYTGAYQSNDEQNFVIAASVNPATAPNAVSDMVETGGQNGGVAGQQLNTNLPSTQNMALNQPAPAIVAAPLTVSPVQQPTQIMQATPAPQIFANAPHSNQMPQAAPLQIQEQYQAMPAILDVTNSSMASVAYIVQESDTVYSLSRKTCSTVDYIKRINGLSAEFLIKAGQTIRLPVSSC